MRRDLRGARILITGASSDIGRCLAEQAAREGARLALVARSAEKLHELADALTALGTDVLALPADVTSDGDRQHILSAVVERFDRLDVLINAAGAGSRGRFVEGSEETLRQVMEVNFFAPAELIRLSIPVLRKGRRPAVVNVASICGRLGLPAWSEYSSSDFALCGLTEALRGEMVRFAIDVLLVLSRERQRPEAPEKTAAGILRALKNNRTETVLGWDARWLLRVHRFLPRLMNALLARQVRRLHASA